jgi:hypothetical protein
MLVKELNIREMRAALGQLAELVAAEAELVLLAMGGQPSAADLNALERHLIQLDLNNPEILANLFALNKPEAWAVLETLRLLKAMT